MAQAHKQTPAGMSGCIVIERGRRTRVTGAVAEAPKVVVSKARIADTLAEAGRTGRPASLTLPVWPDGAAELLATADPADALEGALAAARARGEAKAADVLRGEDMLTAREFGALIGASHETVNVKRKRFEVLGVEGATRGVKYPRWQVTDAGLPLPGLAQVFAVLRAQPWSVYRFLKTAHAELGGHTALDALKTGRVDATVSAAQNQMAGAFA